MLIRVSRNIVAIVAMKLIDRVGRPLVVGLSASGSFNSTLELVWAREFYVYKPLLKGCVKLSNRSLNQVVKLTAIYLATNKVVIPFLLQKPVTFTSMRLSILYSQQIYIAYTTNLYCLHKFMSMW